MSAQSLISQGYGGYAGWGDTEADADFRATGGSGKKTTPSGSSSSSAGGFSSLNPQDSINAAIEAMKKANEPAIASFQAQIPEIQSKYAQTKSQLQASQPSLEQRYQGLLDQIKGQQTADVTAQTKATNATLAARGLSTQDSGAQEDLAGALQPINSQYTGMATQTGLAKEDAIRDLQDRIANLTPQEQSDVRAVQNAIAGLSSGAGQSGVQAGLNLYSTNLSAQQAAQQRADQQAQQAVANQLAQAQLANQTKQVNYETGKPYSTDSGVGDISALQAIFGGNKSSEPRPSAPGKVGSYSPGGQWYQTPDGWAPVTN
jgi:hypothetical protein